MTEQDPLSDLDLELSAYLDGELDPARADALETRLAAEPELAERLAALRTAEARFVRELEAVEDAPLPEGLLSLLESGDAAPAANVAGLQQRRPAPLPLALAAGIALVVGFLLARLVVPPAGAPGDSLLAGGVVDSASPLHDVLQHQPSGTLTELAGGAVVTPVMSFAAEGGGYCRELQVQSAAGGSRALACTRSGAAWQVEVAEFAPADAAGYQVAGSSSAVARAGARRRAGEPLDAEEEAALLGRW